MRQLKLTMILAGAVTLGACSSAYYSAWEKLGVHKRDILVDRVEDTVESQEDAQEQFADALEQFRAFVNVEGGDLEDIYDELNGEYQASEARAEEVRDRIRSVEKVAEDLFEEWQEELSSYENADYRRQSQQQLRDTRQRYQQVLRSMKKAESRMEPVLTHFRDQVLFLKHNLNARALASLQGEYQQIKTDVDKLIADMQQSIAEAQRFIEQMQAE